MREDDPRIDAALRSYAEPPHIPDSRIALAHIHQRAQASSRRRLAGWIIVPLAASLAILIVFLLPAVTRRPGRGPVPRLAWTPTPPPLTRNLPFASGPALRGQTSHSASPRSASPRTAALRSGRRMLAPALPKLAVFPTPRPLSSEEQALLAFAAHAPAELKQQIIQAQQQPISPIATAELKIAPLKIRPLNDPEQDSAQGVNP